MGGMIAQTMAIEHPRRVLTLTSVMATTGEREYFTATPEATAALFRVPASDRVSYIADSGAAWTVFAGPRYFDAEKHAVRAAAAFDRSFYPEGVARQFAAIVASGNRADALRTLSVPTLVIHGRADPLIHVSGGQRTAELIPGATLLLLHDAGHDIPEPLWPFVTSVMAAHFAHGRC
jgi:pimeloyl-ACP methyl ester carboxylesterase